MKKLSKALPYARRPAELLLGVVFLGGALAKALDVNLFVVQVSYYHVLENQTLLAMAALGTLWVETALGMALLLGYRLRGLTYAALLALLLVFTSLIAYAWVFYDLEDCGCFGPIEISPGLSIAKNVVLALLGVVAWTAHLRSERRVVRSLVRIIQTLVILLTACGGVLYAYSTLEELGSGERPYAEFVFEEEGVQWDLGTGDYLVALLSMSCEHCQEAVEPINELLFVEGFPPVVGLCYEEDDATVETFTDLTQPLFTLHSMGDRIRKFFNLVGEGEVPPRFVVVRDGIPLRDWYEEAPEASEVLEALGIE
ncbi:MAG: hypothetical protein GWP08_12575 [Nitrospiraceae bacterium]|nr:hypothetical protein [Nitrospiraceae bacterium]